MKTSRSEKPKTLSDNEKMMVKCQYGLRQMLMKSMFIDLMKTRRKLKAIESPDKRRELNRKENELIVRISLFK